jgi:hypothetical protein
VVVGDGADRAVRAIRQARKTVQQIPLHPPAQRRPMPPACAATSATPPPSKAARTASNRCSTTGKTTSANPGLPSPGVITEDVSSGRPNQPT